MNQQQVKQVLRNFSLPELGQLDYVIRRPGCSVWRTYIETDHGDAELHLQLYAFYDEPESIVEFEEEITMLTDVLTHNLTLIKEIRDQDWGILIIANKEDEEIIKRFFSQTEAASTLSYHPQLDRILGGDYFRQLNGNWLKCSLYSEERAMQLVELLKEAQQAYETAPEWLGKVPFPLPRILAIIGITDTYSLKAPASYRKLALLTAIISSPEVLQRQMPAGEDEAQTFVRQLFGFLHTQHQHGICYSRDAGCCLRPEFLLANGTLTDAYFMIHPEKIEERIHYQEVDLYNALLITSEMSNKNSYNLNNLLRTASLYYTGSKKLANEIDKQIENATHDLASNKFDWLQGLVKILL